VDEAFLYLSSGGQIHVQVRHRGLEVIMAKAVFDIGCRVSSGQHIDRTGVPQAVNRMDDSQPFRG